MAGARERVLAGNPEPYDTAEVIRQYKAKYPKMKIRVMEKEFEKRPKWGWIIKYNYDAAIARAKARKDPKDKDIIILTNDIDVRDMSEDYLRDVIDTLDQKRGQADGVVGRIDHDQETYQNWPNFFTVTRFDQFIDAQNRRGYKGKDAPQSEGEGYAIRGNKREKHVITQGRNTAIRGSAYSAVGGANVETDAGADTELGHMVRFGRKGMVEPMMDTNRSPIAYLNKAWLETDPRRELGKYKSGEAVAWAWNDWDKMNVYGKTFGEQVSGDSETLSIPRLESEFNETVKKWGVAADSEVVKRAMSWLGLEGFIDPNDESKGRYKDYTIENGRIKINTLEHLQKAVDEWIPRRSRRARIKRLMNLLETVSAS